MRSRPPGHMPLIAFAALAFVGLILWLSTSFAISTAAPDPNLPPQARAQEKPPSPPSSSANSTTTRELILEGRVGAPDGKAVSRTAGTIDGGRVVTLTPPGDDVRVIVQLEQEPVSVFMSRTLGRRSTRTATEARAVRDYRRAVLDAQDSVLAEAQQRRLSLTTTQRYSFVFNGLAVSGSREDVDALADLPNVKRVYPDQIVRATLEESVPLIGAPQVALTQTVACRVDAVLPLRQILMGLREAQVQFAAVG